MAAAPNPAKHILLMGSPNDRTVRVAGFDAKKQLVYEWDGHTDFGIHLRVPPAAKEYWHLLWFSPDRFNIGAPKIVINCMANADIMTKALAKAQTIVEPERLLANLEIKKFTSRDEQEIAGYGRQVSFTA